MVRAARLDADHRDSEPLARRLPQLVERRIKLIETNKEIGLIERPEYKRRWNDEPWEDQEQRALRNWLLDRLETPKYRQRHEEHPELTTTAQMADMASGDPTSCKSPPCTGAAPTSTWPHWSPNWSKASRSRSCPSCGTSPRACASGRSGNAPGTCSAKQDAGEDVGDIPVPPKYATADFLKTDYWRLRGKLDVPKERWISYPHLQTESDPTLVVGWAGWNHLQQATALVAYYDARKREGWDAKRLTPLLAGLDQLCPGFTSGTPRSTRVRRDGGPVVPDDAGARRPRTRPDAGRHPQLAAARDDRHERRTRT